MGCVAAFGCLLSPAGQAQSALIQFKQASAAYSEGIGLALIELVGTGITNGARVTFQTANLDAVAGVDYSSVSETYLFTGGETSISLAVPILDNTQWQPDRQFKVTLINPVGLTIGTPSEVTVTIADNDEPTSPGRGAAGTNIFQGIYAMGTNSTGAIVAGGNFRSFNGVLQNHLARILPDGEIDPTFTPGYGPDRQIWALAVQPDDRTLVAGDFQNINGTGRNRIARLTATGEVDSTFDPGTGANNQVSSIELQSNNEVLIAGQFDNINGTPRSDVALLNSNGSLDTSFNAVTPPSFFGYVARRDGAQILVGGFVLGPGANVTNSLMRFDLTGTRDTGFQVSVGDSAYNQVYDLVVQPDLKVVVCGNFLNVNGVASSGIARLKADGTIDPSFVVGTGSDDTILKVRRQDDGKLIIGGVFTSYDGTPRAGIARLNVDGSLDTTFDPGAGANDYVYDALPLADGGTLVGGAFSQFNGYDRFRLAEVGANGSLRTTPVAITSYSMSTGPALHLNLAVEPGRRFRILSSPLLTGWSPVSTNSTARRSFQVALPVTGDKDFFNVEQAFDAP